MHVNLFLAAAHEYLTESNINEHSAYVADRYIIIMQFVSSWHLVLRISWSSLQTVVTRRTNLYSMPRSKEKPRTNVPRNIVDGTRLINNHYVAINSAVGTSVSESGLVECL